MLSQSIFHRIFFSFALFFFFIIHAHSAPLGQVLQISTHFKNVWGKPTWLLIIRNTETGLVLPYLFDITKEDNSWVAFTSGPTYQITESKLMYGPYAKINNFCNLKRCVIRKKSMWISLTGNLAPVKDCFKCKVILY